MGSNGGPRHVLEAALLRHLTRGANWWAGADAKSRKTTTYSRFHNVVYLGGSENEPHEGLSKNIFEG